MLAIVPSLLALLALASFTQARTYTPSTPGVLSVTWSTGAGSPSSFQATEALCQAATDALTNGVGYWYEPNGEYGVCYPFTSYPSLCSGYYNYGSPYQQAMVNRCSSGPAGYALADDSSCIYTGGAALTEATYSGSCANGAPVTNPAPSQAPYKRRQLLEQSAFVGGKVCPIGEMACPLAKGFGCMNVKENLNSCGGCIGGAGVDCSDIIGANEVACENGSCIVKSCTRGFTRSSAGQCLRN